MTGGGSAGRGHAVAKALYPHGRGLGASAWSCLWSAGQAKAPPGNKPAHWSPGPALAGSLGAPLNTVNPASFPRTQVTHPLLAWLVPTLPLGPNSYAFLSRKPAWVRRPRPRWPGSVSALPTGQQGPSTPGLDSCVGGPWGLVAGPPYQEYPEHRSLAYIPVSGP